MLPHVGLRSGTLGTSTSRFIAKDPSTGAAARVVASIVADEQRSGLTSNEGFDLVAAADLALNRRVPLVIELAAYGPSVDEGIAALDGWGQAARAIVSCSGIIPTIAIVTGPVVAGPALLLGLVDIVVMVADGYSFVSGPRMVAEYTGQPVDSTDLGGAAVHDRTSGVASYVADSIDEAREFVDEVLDYLPASIDELPGTIPTSDPVDRRLDDVYEIIPETATGSYDVREVIGAVVDDGIIVELRESWAANLVTALASIGGMPVGIVANQPQTVAGTLDIAASQKGGRFVGFCDAFNLPIVTFVDTSGFYPGKDLEWRGMIRYGAQLAFAYSRATVPRVAVTLRKSYGGAYIVMDSKYIGNDLSYAWPSAEIAVMGAKGAVEILHRRASDEERAARQAEYEERLLNPYIAAERGSIEGVINPADTRTLVADSLATLRTKRERLPRRRHDNLPL